MSDWLQLSPDGEKLFRSCREHESILLLEGKWVKMPISLIHRIIGEAHMAAAEDAFKRAGIDCTVVRGTGESGNGIRIIPSVRMVSMGFDLDVASETVTASIELEEGRKLVGFAMLKRPRLH